MIKTSIKATSPKSEKKNRPEEKSATIQVDWVDVEKDPDAALEELKQMCGAKAIITNAFANFRVTVQGSIRTGLDNGETQEQIQARLASVRMGVTIKGAARDAEAEYLAKLDSADDDEAQAMVERLQQAIAKKKAAKAGAAPGTPPRK